MNRHTCWAATIAALGSTAVASTGPASLAPSALPGDFYRVLSSCRAGDVDGDGTPDIAIGLPRDDAHGEDAGRVFVISGRDGHTLRELSMGIPFAGFGFSLDGGADLDGDGQADLLVSAHRDGWRVYDPEETQGRPGAVYEFSLVAGKRDPIRSAKPERSGANPNFGSVVRHIGDLDGDSRSDFVVENRDEAECAHETEAPVRCFSGKSGEQIARSRGQMNGSVHVVGDLDGDGCLDIAQLAPGRIVVASMRSSRELLSVPAKPLGLTFLRASDAGDLDGDRRPDLAVVARDPKDPTDTVVAMSGMDGHVIWRAPSPRFQPAGGGTQTSFNDSSFELCRLQDVDGDKVGDVLVGLSGMQGHELGACILSGKSGAVLRFLPGTSQDNLSYSDGHALAEVGDLDGDGVPEFAIGKVICVRSYPFERYPGGVLVRSGKTGELLFGGRPVPGTDPVVYGRTARRK